MLLFCYKIRIICFLLLEKSIHLWNLFYAPVQLSDKEWVGCRTSVTKINEIIVRVIPQWQVVKYKANLTGGLLKQLPDI